MYAFFMFKTKLNQNQKWLWVSLFLSFSEHGTCHVKLAEELGLLKFRYLSVCVYQVGQSRRRRFIKYFKCTLCNNMQTKVLTERACKLICINRKQR